MRINLKFLALALCGALAIGGCGDDKSMSGAGTTAVAGAGFPMTLDNCGRKVTIDEAPEKILTIGSDPAAAVVAAGGGDRIVGRSSEGGAPLGPFARALARAPQITRNDPPSLETVVGKTPDLIVSYELDGTDLPAGLASSGIEQLTPAWRCDTDGVGFDDIYAQIDELGKVFGTSDAADRAVTKLRSRQNAVEQRFSKVSKRTATAIYVAESGLSAYANRSVDHTIIETLGLTDVFADVAQRNVEVSIEELIKRNPDVVIATFGGSGTEIKTGAGAIEALRARPGINRLAAVRKGRIIPIHFGYLVGGPLAIDGLESIARRLATLK
ncbi:MAG TPA: ABC transporter substrate-binding protein [Solirubrobacteraceae bacterium]|jgi:iron complex transport system substrate-binding protein|nr:ABC transporter substrate-binding protein [Solirubrobacteraceae bacterium]